MFSPNTIKLSLFILFIVFLILIFKKDCKTKERAVPKPWPVKCAKAKAKDRYIDPKSGAIMCTTR